ncbi:MAG TPA: LysR family transcriptional regulator [Noviherbaspirillum sp.]
MSRAPAATSVRPTAADRLGIAKAKVSLQISRLESRLGVTLFNRTTRQVSLSDAGRMLHAECRPLLQRMQEAVDHAVQSLAPALSAFALLHPDLQIDLRTGDWALPRAGVYAVYPPGRHVPAKVRAFIDFYREWLQRA